MKKTGLFLIATIASSMMFAQSVGDAIKKTTNEQFESADQIFKTLIQNQPNNGELYFYYGENYYKNDKIADAEMTYQKGVDVNATHPLPYVGLGKVQLEQGKLAEAKANFYKATTLAAGKNAVVLREIAKAYIYSEKSKNVPEAMNLLSQAEKIDPKSPELYILMGDAYLEMNDGSKAVVNYEKAESLDKKSPIAQIKQGQLYNRAKNYTLALEFYKKASLIDSMYAPAYREKAEIYLRAQQYRNAVQQMKRYLDLNNECSAQSRYAGILFEAKEYALSVETAKAAMACDSNNSFLYRYLAFSQYETQDFAGGLMNSDKFFSKIGKDTIKIIPKDYEYRAKLLVKNGKDSLAALEYQKAMKRMPEKTEYFGDIANAYMKMKKYPEAIEAYKMKMAKGKPNVNDTLSIGRAYYYSKDFINADSAFSGVIKSQPNLHNGYFWKARAIVQQDVIMKTDWNAKQWYEAYISKMKPEDVEKNKKDLVEAYTYLAAYYAKKKDCPNTKSNFQKVIELDPTNSQAKKFLAAPGC
ncbi:MAG: tetratricopeptide repeat protein [Bacteroidota bacterium]|nr:tetratricopeptide repeat protein [Bacteroidota bacterium]